MVREVTRGGGMPAGPDPKTPNDLAWTAKEKRVFAGVVAAAVLAVALWGWGSTSLRRSESCRVCLSARETRQWGLGTADGRAFLAAGTDIEVHPSDLAGLLPVDHVHDWHEESTSTTVLGSRRYLGCNLRQANPLVHRFEQRYPFRRFLEARIGEGALPRPALAAMAELPGAPPKALLDDPARRAILERAQDLLVAGGGGADPGWEAALSGPSPGSSGK